MKKGEFSALKKARRRTMKDVSLLKKFKSDERDSSKDVVQIITSKLVSETNSAWFGSELLYIIQIQKRARKVTRQGGQESNKNIQNSNAVNDRYIAMLRKKDVTQSIVIIRLVMKDNDIEIKNIFDLSILRSIDFGSEDNELLLSYDQADYNIYFINQNERDETIWIIIQVCKHILRNDIIIGYSIDIDALTYITTTNGTLTRFPLLYKLVQHYTKELGDYFNKEEIEAETLLDELNWGSAIVPLNNNNNTKNMNLQENLSKQSEQLNDEIIDFLLQWEEMDLTTNTTNNNNKINNSTSTSATSTSNTTINNNKLKINNSNISDTSEVLQALSQVDNELKAVDLWLNEQIEHLEVIQYNLHMIEDESGALESSWCSLKSVQDIVTLLINRYTINNIHEELLLHPEKIMNLIYKSNNLIKINEIIEPLVTALLTVRNSLKMKFNEINTTTGTITTTPSTTNTNSISGNNTIPNSNPNNNTVTTTTTTTNTLTIAQWKQLQSMTSISSQRAKLTDIVDTFCELFHPTASTIFEFLLKHKTLLDSGLSIKQFQFPFSIYIQNNNINSNNTTNKNKINFTTIPLWYTKIKSPEFNQFMKARLIYESYLQNFIPLLNIFLELAPKYSLIIQESYLKSIIEYFYKPIFKQLSKDINHLVNNKYNIYTLSNIGKYKIKENKPILPLQFDNNTSNSSSTSNTTANNNTGSNNNGVQNGNLNPWIAYRAALLTIVPVLEHEEMFVEVSKSIIYALYVICTVVVCNMIYVYLIPLLIISNILTTTTITTAITIY